MALNPFKNLTIYDLDTVLKYRGVRLGDLPPHIFAIADEAHNSMLAKRANQCVVISGESGAGKTESTKLIVSYLAHLSGKHSQVEEQLVDSSPILESFGNAKTTRNNNSSRFGKFMEIQFSEFGSIEGARINECTNDFLSLEPAFFSPRLSPYPLPFLTLMYISLYPLDLLEKVTLISPFPPLFSSSHPCYLSLAVKNRASGT